MRWVPDSIAGRALMVLLVGLTLFHLASTLVLPCDRHEAIIDAGDRLSVDTVAVLAGLLDRISPSERERLVRGLGSPFLSVSIDAAPIVSPAHRDEAATIRLPHELESRFDGLDRDRLHVAWKPQAHRAEGFSWWIARPFHAEKSLLATLELKDGAWANLSVTTARPTALWSSRSMVSAAVMIVGILVFGRWTSGWVSAPLATFARAAERLGRDVQAPPLSEQGPREVRQAVAAFNEMQARIRRFVEDRTRMLAAISHDLRSPITRLRLRAEMLPKGEGRERTLADLDEMEAMVASALDFAQGETADEPATAIDLSATLQAVCDNAADMGLPAEFEWPGRLICVGRPLAIKRALANLVENAARYGGRAVVHVRREGRAVVVVIEDEGPGIPEAEMRKVFMPFYRLEASRNRGTGGVGLGLTVAHAIVRAHGGELHLENREEGGLRATVTLPQGHVS